MTVVEGKSAHAQKEFHIAPMVSAEGLGRRLVE